MSIKQTLDFSLQILLIVANSLTQNAKSDLRSRPVFPRKPFVDHLALRVDVIYIHMSST